MQADSVRFSRFIESANIAVLSIIKLMFVSSSLGMVFVQLPHCDWTGQAMCNYGCSCFYICIHQSELAVLALLGLEVWT